MTTGPEGGVDQDGAGAVAVMTGQRGSEKFDTSVDQHGNVSVPTGPGCCINHGRTSERMDGPCTEVPDRIREPGVGEVRQGRFGQRPRCTGTWRDHGIR